jgi:predicted acetyltransferase
MLPGDFRFLHGFEPERPWADHLARTEAIRRGDGPPGTVPGAFLVAVVEGEIVGRVSIRFALDDYLLDRGGHIGYGVRAARRRRGHATEMLGQALIIARAEGVDRVLVSCDDDNVASARAIERHGGVLEDVRRDDEAPLVWRRYWID